MSRLSKEFRERTKRFASRVVRLVAALPRQRMEVEVIGCQLLRAGTSVAGQTREASRARSSAEFCSKIEGALQEADESQLWLELLKENCGVTGDSLDWLHQESNELVAIFVTIVSKLKNPSF
jgi:four helix bundle protein